MAKAVEGVDGAGILLLKPDDLDAEKLADEPPLTAAFSIKPAGPWEISSAKRGQPQSTELEEGSRDMVVRKILMAVALAASASVGLPSAAYAGDDRGWHRGHDDDDDDDGDRGHGYYRHRGHYYDGYVRRRYYRDDRPRYRCRSGGTTGLIIGGAAGALLGREIDRYGDRTPGTIIGAGAGALLGREIARNRRC